MNEIIPPIEPAPVVASGMSVASKIILGLVILAIVGGAVVMYVVKKPNEEPKKEIVPKSASGPNVKFTTDARHLRFSDMPIKGREGIVDLVLEGEIYDEPIKLSVVTRDTYKNDAPEHALQAFFSAEKANDCYWKASLYVPDDQNFQTNSCSYSGERNSETAESLAPYDSVYVTVKVYYKDSVFFLFSHDGAKKFNKLNEYKKVGDRWYYTSDSSAVETVLIYAKISADYIATDEPAGEPVFIPADGSSADDPMVMAPIDFTKDFRCSMDINSATAYSIGSVDGVFTHPFVFQGFVKQVFVGEDVYIKNQTKNEPKGEPLRHCDWLKTKTSSLGTGWATPVDVIKELPDDYERSIIKCEQKPLPKSVVEINGVICDENGAVIEK